jgi:NADH:ubiquinone reductase (non-electrogenic)
LTNILQDDLKSWYPELADRIKISLVEALPSVLPMFSKQLIDYTESTFRESKIEILTKTMVKEVLGGQLLSCSFTHLLRIFTD